MTKRTEQFTPYDLGKPYQKQQYDNASLGGHTFWINPTSIRKHYERIHKEVPTKAGIFRFDYGIQAVVYTLEGSSGNASLAEIIDRAKGMGKIMPSPANIASVALEFNYQAMGIRKVQVYVNSYDHWMDSSMVNYHQYSMELMELPPRNQAPYTTQTVGYTGAARN